MSRRDDALASVNEERDRQYKIWGDQDHSIPEWLMILGEEFGEACEAGCRVTWEQFGEKETRIRLGMVRRELVETAAVAVQIIEHLDTILQPTKAVDDRAERIAERAPISPEAAALMSDAIEKCTIHDECKDALQMAADTFMQHGYSEALILMAVRRWASGFYPVPVIQQRIALEGADE